MKYLIQDPNKTATIHEIFLIYPYLEIDELIFLFLIVFKYSVTISANIKIKFSYL